MRKGLYVALACAGVLLAVSPVLAQTSSPSPKAPTVEGEVTGALAKGSTLVFSVDATMPGGWEALHLLEIVVRSGDRELERITYDIEDVQITVGEQRIVVGTGGVAAGDHLRVSGADVVVTTGGGNLSFEVIAEVLDAIPAEARFDLSVTDDFAATAVITASLAEPPGEGITWATVAALIAGALFAGGFVGNLFASKRRPPARASVYAAMQHRIDSERASGGSPASR